MNNNIYYTSPSLSSIFSENEPEINEILQLNNINLNNNQSNENDKINENYNENYNENKLKEKNMSKKFQLFQEIPELEFVLKIINCFNLKDLNDKKKFTKKDLVDFKTKEKIEDLLPELVIYYLPCKYEMFLNNLNIQKCITILRQMLRIFNYSLTKKENVINKKKIIYYSIQKNITKNIQIHNNPTKCIINFS
jgi:hypothetical protein